MMCNIARQQPFDEDTFDVASEHHVPYKAGSYRIDLGQIVVAPEAANAPIQTEPIPHYCSYDIRSLSFCPGDNLLDTSAKLDELI